ncbi:LLM class flavin-dependent oxidoreductase, partial [Nocardia abscessus]|uniref:LLM class flavin-dependent oxidoreductase n=1 Tax=Nocardia abscessus TaxID=120957 RepID=UPI002457E0BE
MRVGVMIGPEKGDSGRKLERMLRDIEWAESAGMDTAWIPQIPTDFDALITIAAMGLRTSRIELGTAVVGFEGNQPNAQGRPTHKAHPPARGRRGRGGGPAP